MRGLAILASGMTVIKTSVLPAAAKADRKYHDIRDHLDDLI